MSNRTRVPFGPITGLDQRHFPTDGSLATATNVRTDNQGAWSQCCGLTALFKYSGQQPSPLTGKGEIETMAWFSQHQGGRQWLVWEHRTSPTSSLVDLVAFSGSERSFRIISPSRRYYAGPWLKTTTMAHNDWLYYVNGYDAPERWNGRWKTRIGFEQAAAAPIITDKTVQDWIWPNFPTFATAPDRANGVGRRGVGPRPEDGDSSKAPMVPSYYKYGYAVTYVNDQNQESPVSEIRFMTGYSVGWNAAAPAYVGVGKKGNLIVLPRPPEHAKGLRLWRTQNVSGISATALPQADLYLVAEFPNGVDSTYADLKADDELGRKLDRNVLGPFPRTARLLAMFRGCLFAAVASGNTSTLQYSATNGFIEQFPVDNTLPIGDADSGHITAMYSMKDALVVCKERGIYLVRQDADNFFRAQTLTEDSGCSSQRCVVEVPGRGLLLVGTAGIRLLSGALANEGVPTTVDTSFDVRVRSVFEQRVSVSQLVTAFSVVNHADREVWIQLPESGKARPSFGLVYHYDADAWSVREGWNTSCGVETHDHRGVVYFGSNLVDADSIFQVYQYTNSVEVTTAPFMKAAPMTRRGAQVVWTGADVYTVNFGSGRALGMSVYINRRVLPETELAESRNAIDTESEGIPGEWGTAQWDTGYWGAQSMQPVRFSVTPPGSPTDIQWGMTGTRFAIFGLDLDLTLNQMHKIDASIAAPWT